MTSTKKYVPNYAAGWLGWVKTPFSTTSNIDMPDHAIKFHAEPDGHLLVGKRVKNLVEYAMAVLDLDRLFARIEHNCERLEFDVPSMVEWLDNMPELPQLSLQERMVVRAKVEDAANRAVNAILDARQKTGKLL